MANLFTSISDESVGKKSISLENYQEKSRRNEVPYSVKDELETLG